MMKRIRVIFTIILVIAMLLASAVVMTAVTPDREDSDRRLVPMAMSDENLEETIIPNNCSKLYGINLENEDYIEACYMAVLGMSVDEYCCLCLEMQDGMVAGAAPVGVLLPEDEACEMLAYNCCKFKGTNKSIQAIIDECYMEAYGMNQRNYVASFQHIDDDVIPMPPGPGDLSCKDKHWEGRMNMYGICEPPVPAE